MFTIVLYQPEILPNTGNIIQLCTSTGADLHLVRPLGFPLDSSKMKRVGPDCHEFAKLMVHKNFEDCLKALEGRRIFVLTTKGKTRPDEASFRKGDVFLFGPETHGLSAEILDNLPAERKLRLPMRPGSRSMNLSNTAAVVLFEAWRQNDYQGGIWFPVATGPCRDRLKSEQTLSTRERNYVLTFVRNTFLHHALFIALAAFAVGMLPAAANAADTVIRAEKPHSSANLSCKIAGKRYMPLAKVSSFSQAGKASWYGNQFHGRRTASDKHYNVDVLTAAHRTLPIPSYARVTNTKNGKSVVVRVNDRGPFHGSRVMDVSKAAAQKLGSIGQGTTHIKIEQVLPGSETTMSDMPKKDIYVDSKSLGSESEALAYMNQTGRNLSSADMASKMSVEKRGGSYVVRVGSSAAQEHADEAESRVHMVMQNAIRTALRYGMSEAV